MNTDRTAHIRHTGRRTGRPGRRTGRRAARALLLLTALVASGTLGAGPASADEAADGAVPSPAAPTVVIPQVDDLLPLPLRNWGWE